MPATDFDNWDQHWADFQDATEIAPSVSWRRQLLSDLLAVKGSGEGLRVLEIGSGLGIFAEQFTAEHPRASFLGLDLSANGVRLASERVQTAEFRQRDLLQPASATESVFFGATHAICSEVLEHVDDPETLLRNAKPYMNPACRLVVTVPGGPRSAFHKHIGHRRHFTAGSLTELLERAGYQVEWASGVGFPFYNLYLALLVARGDKAIEQFTKRPGASMRAASAIFKFLFRMSSRRAGWQVAAVAQLP